jgi:hypothetical protein
MGIYIKKENGGGGIFKTICCKEKIAVPVSEYMVLSCGTTV